MKFPDAISNLLGKKEEQKNFFFSLFLDIDAAAVAAWHVDASGSPKIVSFAHGKIAEDSWEARIQVVDRLLSAAEDKANVEHAISKTVFGMPGIYLTPEGNIVNSIRPHLKKLTTVLELSAVGFVPLSQAIAFLFKKDEGVPPSVILIGCSGNRATVTIFRVGKMVGEQSIDITGDPAVEIEQALKQYQQSDVLPSRMLLFGGDEALLESVRGKLLKHPWPTRANFLHFPKIEVFSTEKLLSAVSLSGASELAAAIGESDEGDISAEASSVVAQPTRDVQSVMPDESDQDQEIEPEEIEGDDEDTVVDEAQNDGTDTQEDGEIEDETEEEVSSSRESDEGDEEESNIHVVSPEALGFERQDILVSHAKKQRTHDTNEQSHPPDEELKHKKVFAKDIVGLFSRTFSNVPKLNIKTFFSTFGHMRHVHGARIPMILGVVSVCILMGILYYTLPGATVTVLVAPVSLEESAVLTVDPAATIADPATKVIPGRTQEKSVSGQKTASVTGKKKVGDPARGTVTVYNKETHQRSLKKGTVLSAKSLTFTLDDDVSVASASESIGSITFGKANVSITAVEIGASSNLPASTEFTFKDSSPSVVSARNDAALSGGVSREVTVVTRADYDAMVKSMTDELVVKAKTDLSTQIGAEQLIDQTVETAVTEKVFDKELDEEAKELNGKVTVSVSGTSIRDEDVKAILTALVAAKVPGGYSLSSDNTQVETSGIQVKKDGTITLTATLKAVALPAIDSGVLVNKLVGKSVPVATGILKETQGVAGAEFRFTFSPFQRRLPINAKNITVTISVAQ